MKFILFILLVLLLIPGVEALNPSNEMVDTHLEIISYTENVPVGGRSDVITKLTYANGTELNIEYMDRIAIVFYVNGKRLYGISLCNASGGLHVVPKMETAGEIEIQCVFEGRDYYGLRPSTSGVVIVNVIDTNEPPQDIHIYDMPLKLIAYAKGLFMVSFFGTLFLTIGTGCISVQTNDPQKKADSQQRLFFLLKVLITVTIIYLGVLFMVP